MRILTVSELGPGCNICHQKKPGEKLIGHPIDQDGWYFHSFHPECLSRYVAQFENNWNEESIQCPFQAGQFGCSHRFTHIKIDGQNQIPFKRFFAGWFPNLMKSKNWNAKF